MEAMDDEVKKLLRIKRYEKPPEGYYENFLKEFKDRQKTERLKIELLPEKNTSQEEENR